MVRGELNSVAASATRLRGLLIGAFAFAGLTGGITGSIRLLADFGQEMSTVRAITQATEAQFQALNATAQGLGATTRFSAVEAAEGMKFLARAGFDTNEVLGSIEGTLKLAQAGALDLGSAADIASNVLQGFRLSTDQTGRVVDVLAKAANSSNTSVQQLGDALKFVAPVAAGVGLSLEDTTAAVSSLSNAGLQASLAGTGLRRVISGLEAPTQAGRDAIERLGTQIDRGQISAVGLFASLQQLSDAGVDTATALEAFGQRGGPAFEVLSSAIPETRALAEELRNAGGTADEIARIMDDNLNGALLATRSAIQAIVLSFGDIGANEFLKDFFFELAAGLRRIANNASEALHVIQGVALALGTTLATRAIPAAIGALRGLATAIATNPLGFLAQAAVLATTAFVAFSSQLQLSAGSSATVLDFLVVLFQKFANGVRSAIDFALGLFGTFEDSLDAIDFRVIAQNASVGLEILVAAFKGSFESIKALVQNVIADLVNGVIRGLNFLQNKLEDFLTGVNLVKRAFLQQPITPQDVVNFQDLEPVLTGAGQTAGEAYASAFEASIERADIFGFVAGALDEAEQRGARRRGGSLADAVGVEGLGDVVPPVIDDVDTLNGALGTTDGLLRRFLPDGINELEGPFEKFHELITNSASNAVLDLEDNLVSLFRTGKFGFTDMVDSILDDLTRLAIRKNITGPLSDLLFGGDASSGGFNLTKSLLGGGGGIFGGIGGFAKGLFGFQHGVEGAPVDALSIGRLSGADNRLVAFRANSNEEVTVRQRGERGGDTFVFNLPGVRNVDEFRRSQGQVEAMAARTLDRAGRRNN